MQNKNNKKNTACPQCLKHSFCRRGYTIIETMIAISLFIIIVMAGMGALLNANLLHKKSQSMRSIIDNLNFVMEDMSKNLRTGYNFRCYRTVGDITNVNIPQSCATGWAIAFESADGVLADNTDQWVYYIDSGKIFKSTDGGANYIQMTPDEIVISESYAFTVLGAEPPPESPGPDRQPFVIIKLVGSITYNNIVSPFTLQTSVSQRQLDI
jgi:type II secretory pathway pseudopilin PulG